MSGRAWRRVAPLKVAAYLAVEVPVACASWARMPPKLDIPSTNRVEKCVLSEGVVTQ